MWIQSVAVILPRVQEHFNISNDYIGLLTAVGHHSLFLHCQPSVSVSRHDDWSFVLGHNI